ncbi:Bax inhibitor-1 family protein [Nitrosomonas communis]|uniref:Bax inhibitor-1 family protein n=1 Tax=Nitrosomonas communis TaxID=44574 RepID=UPI003D2A3CA6
MIGTATVGVGIISFTWARISTVTRRDYSFLHNFMMILAPLPHLFFAISAVSLAISAAALFLFSGFILLDVSRIINDDETNYIITTLGIYISGPLRIPILSQYIIFRRKCFLTYQSYTAPTFVVLASFCLKL